MRQPWVHSAGFDGALILAPSFLVTLLVLLFPSFFVDHPVTTATWVAVVLCIDVAHVYGSLYRTYLHRGFTRRSSSLLVSVPVFCWLAGFLLYLQGAGAFWSALAYLAVFHFVRQQYGFLRIYSRHEPGGFARKIDAALIYLATLYPLAYWHAHIPRRFHWFMDGDFFPGLPAIVPEALGFAYVATAIAYVVLALKRPMNWPKQLFVAGTMLSWYVGIVALNGDLAFTVTNVVAHGVPYLALVWATGRREGARGIYALWMVPAFFGLLIALAYLEEGLWDGFFWREHAAVFPWFQGLASPRETILVAALVPLLALPQSTHYIFDGILWRNNKTRVGG